MPVLDWIGKAAVVNHHKDVPYRLLEPVPDLSLPLPAGGEGSGGTEAYGGNLIVQGDNLHALKALLPRYAGKVKCIYIDPPYNTGNEGWAYNDNVNSPEIRKWLGEVVGKEGETLDRHDRWLCMMYPRLVLLKQFLSDDGAIFVSIDDNEAAALRFLMNEIFGAQNLVACFIQKRRDVADNRNLDGASADHEYVVCFRSSALFKLRGAAKDISKYSNPDNDPRGPWMSDNLTGLADANERPNLHYDLVDPETQISYPPHPRRGWAVSPETAARYIEEKRILWPKKATGRPRLKRYLQELSSGWTGFSTILKTPGNIAGTRDLGKIFGQKVFAFPKPVDLVRTIIEQATELDSLVLDSFAGTGTTGHAVLKQNAEDGGNRRFILVEMENAVARDVTSERVRRVATGYTNAKGQKVEGLGGGFQFCRLSPEPLFTPEGFVRDDVTFAQLAEFVWFVETGGGLADPHPNPLPAGEGEKLSPLVGVHEGRAIYLLYNGILKDKSVNGGNVLTGPVLEALPEFDGPKVIYAAACRLGRSRLAREGIVFKQTPYALQS